MINRLGLALVGLVLAAAAGYGLARAYRAFGGPRQHDPVLIPGLRTFVADDHRWFWWAAGAVCMIVAVAAARIWGDPANPDVYLRVDMRDGAAVQELLDRIEGKGLDRLRHALQVEAFTTHLDLRVAEPAGRTIR